MKVWQYILAFVVIVLGIVFWKREPLMLAYLANKTPEMSLEERVALIGESIVTKLPEEGEGPFPVVLQFHGCAGIRAPFQEQWADVANRAGYAAMIVDSMGPRGYSRADSLEIVCNGKALLGQERAGDVLAALEIAKSDPRLDPHRIILAGWSHGGWSVMDFLTMDLKNKWPAGLKKAASTPPKINGTILFYPYCGAGTLSRFRNWVHETEVLALIAEADTIVNADECVDYFEKRKRKGDSIDMTVYPGAEHVFDDPFLEPDYIHWYNEEFFKNAVEQYSTFLERLKSAPQQ